MNSIQPTMWFELCNCGLNCVRYLKGCYERTLEGISRIGGSFKLNGNAALASQNLPMLITQIHVDTTKKNKKSSCTSLTNLPKSNQLTVGETTAYAVPTQSQSHSFKGGKS